MVLSTLRSLLFTDVRDVFLRQRNPRPILGSLDADGRTLIMQYPLVDGTYVTKHHLYPDAEMAEAGYQRFMRDVADNLPGNQQRRHLRSLRLNNELIGLSHLSWKIEEEPDYGTENRAVIGE